MFYAISKSGSKCSKRFHISYLLRLFDNEYLKDVPDIEPTNQTFQRHSRNKVHGISCLTTTIVKYVTCEHPTRRSRKPCSHVKSTYAFLSNVQDGFYGNKLWCLHLTFAFSRIEWQR